MYVCVYIYIYIHMCVFGVRRYVYVHSNFYSDSFLDVQVNANGILHARKPYTLDPNIFCSTLSHSGPKAGFQVTGESISAAAFLRTFFDDPYTPYTLNNPLPPSL